MSIETTLKTLLSPLVAGGCHNGANVRSEIITPYVVFHEISGLPLFGISSNDFGATKCRYQIDVFAVSPEQAKGISLDVIKPVLSETELLNATHIFQMSGPYSDITKTYQYITEYSIWAM